MQTKKICISSGKNQGGRPVALLGQAASRFDCHIDVEYHDKKVNAKSIIGMMSLGLNFGEDVIIYADGDDEVQAINDIEKCLQQV